jgi:DNA repair protein RadC
VGASFMAARQHRSQRKAGLSEAPPHYHGHRERLRARFREADSEAALVSFRAIPQRDVKPLAK